MTKYIIPMVIISLLSIMIIPVKAQYDSTTHTLVLENATYYKVKLYPIYKYSLPRQIDITRIIYDPSTNTCNNTTLGSLNVGYYAMDYLTVENLWSNGTLTVEVIPSFREELTTELETKKEITINEGERVILPKDVNGYPAIYNLTFKVDGKKIETLVVEIKGKPEKIRIDLDTGKEYDDSVVIGDNAYVKINALGATRVNWELLGFDTPPNGSIAINPNDEIWILINSSWLYYKYGLQPKTYTLHVSADGVDAYTSIYFSEPLLSLNVNPKDLASGYDVEVTVHTNAIKTGDDLDGAKNRFYIAIVRGVYTGRVNVTNNVLQLPDSSNVPKYMLYLRESKDLNVSADGNFELKYTIDAPGLENVTYWTVVAVVVTNASAGTVDYFYRVAYTFFKIIVPSVEVSVFVTTGYEASKTTELLRGDKFQIRGYADLPAKPGLLTPNHLWIFVEDGQELGITAQPYSLFGLKGTLEKVYVLDESGYFESSVWKVDYNASFKCYRVFAIVTGDGKEPNADNIMNVSFVNVTVIRPTVEVEVEEKVPPGSTLKIHGYAQTKYVYIYSSDDVFENIPDNPSNALKVMTYRSGEGKREFTYIGLIREDADYGEYYIYVYASNSERFDEKTCLEYEKVKFEIVPLEVKPENLTVVRGENDLLKFHMNGELSCRVVFKFKVDIGYDYTNTTHPFGMVYEGQKYVCGRTFYILIPTHYNDQGLTTEMGERAIPAGKYKLEISVYSNRTDKLMLKRTFYVNIVEPEYEISTTNKVMNGKIVVIREDQLIIKIKSNRKCHYNWLFFALKGELGLQKCGWIELINGVKELRIDTSELTGNNFEFYLVDTMGSGDKNRITEYYDFLPNYGYDVIKVNGIICKVYKGNPYTKAYKGDDDLIITFKIEIVDTQIQQYYYYFPIVDPNGSIYVHSIHGETDVYLDLNFNGVRDSDEPFATINSSWFEFKIPPDVECIRLISNKPVATFYSFRVDEEYKDFSYEYSPSFAGKEFVVPMNGYAYITPTQNSALIEIFYGNVSLGKKFIKVGEVWKIKVTSGCIIKSSNDVVCVLKYTDDVCKDNSWAVSLIPTTYFGREILLPPKIEVDYEDYQYIKELAYVTYIDGTVKVVDLSDKPNMLKLKKPAVAYIFYDAYVRDMSSAVYSLRHHTFAFKVYPVEVNGNYGIAFTILSPYNTRIIFDSNYDGVFDNTTIIKADNVYNEPVKTKTGIHTVEKGIFKSEKPVMVYSVELEEKGLSSAYTLTTYRIENKSQYEYWFPLTVLSSKESGIYVHSLYGKTEVYLDLNFNGVRDSDEPFATINSSWFKFNVNGYCVKLVSDKPVVTYYEFVNDNTAFSYSPSSTGFEFVVPFDGFAYITATEVKTIVQIVNKEDVNEYVIDIGDILKVKVKQGSFIKSVGRIAVTLSSCDACGKVVCDNQTWAVSLIPTSEFDNTLFIPPKVDTHYTDHKYVKCLAYITYSDGTVKVINLVKDARKITTEKPAVAYVLFDTYARDFSCSIYRIKHYSFAFKVYPVSELGTKGIAFTLVSTSNGNFVKLDRDSDGVFDKTITLNEGEVLINRGVFKSRYPVLVYNIQISTNEAISAFAYKPVEKVEIVPTPTEKEPLPLPTPMVITTTPTPIQTPIPPVPTTTTTHELYKTVDVISELFKVIQELIQEYIKGLFKGILGQFQIKF